MPVNDMDIRMLVYAARRLRDETYGCKQWDEAGTFEVFKQELAGHNLLIATQRVIGHATDPDAKTPGAIKRPFVPEPTKTTAHQVEYDPAKVFCHVCGEREHVPNTHVFMSIEAWRAVPKSPPPDDIRDAIADKPTTWPARVKEEV